MLAYLVPAALSAIAVQTWFEPGTAIASGDLVPPVASEADYTSHWSHLAAGEGAPGYGIVGLPYAAWLDAWTWLGAGAEVGQRLWLTALFSGSAAAVVFLAFGFRASPLAAGTAGLLASFNAYRLITTPDPLTTSAILVAALLSGLVARAVLQPERKTSVLGFATASVGLGYVMSNPPHVVLVILWVVACLAIGLVERPGAARRTFRFLGNAVPLALLFNAWWIVPAWLTLVGPGLGDRFVAAGVEEWAWTHHRATLANALTLNTVWSWSYPEYFPYAESLDALPFNLLKIYLPVLAALGLLFGRWGDRKVKVGFAVTALIAAWLTTGLHAPVPTVNRWLYDYVPGYWLFREPSKFLLLVVLPLALLGGAGVSRLFEVGRPSLGRRLLAVGLVAGALLYVHPLFTGEVIADERPLLPPAHVDVPDAWRQATQTLNAQPGSGKVLILPRSDFYQVPTTWGYYGASFTRPMIRRPVLEAQPGGYFRPAQSVASFEESIESDLINERTAEVGKKLAALGVSYILLRRDVDSDFPKRRIARPNVLGRTLKRVPGIHRVRSFGMLELYRAASTSNNDVFAATPAFYAGSAGALAPAVTVINGRPGFVSRQDDQKSLAQSGVRPIRIVRFEQERVRHLAVKNQGGRLLVRLADPFRLTIGGRRLPRLTPEGTAVPIPQNEPVVFTAGNAVIPLRRAANRWENLALVGLQSRESVRVWQFAGARSIQPSSGGPVGDCNAFDDRGAEEVGIRAAVKAHSGGSTLRLMARAHSACVTFPLVPGPSQDLFSVRFRYRSLGGAPARACLLQSGVDRCAPVPDLRPGRTWRTFEAAVRPHPRMTALSLFVYADGWGRGPATVTEYQGIRLERYRRAADVPRGRAQMQALPPNASSQSTLAFGRPLLSRPIDLANASPVGDCNRYDRRPMSELGLAARMTDRSDLPVLQLAARNHSACVNLPISPFEPGAPAYRIRLEYRRVSGSAPRVCLWQAGPDRCVPLPPLASDARWRVVDRTVRLDPDVLALRLFLYADGGGGRPTVAEYRNVHVGAVGSVAIVGMPRKEPLPRIVARREAPGKFRVRVTGARAPFLLATSEAYASGWKASAEGRRDSDLRHVQVNGYANAWLVPWKGSYEMTLEYEPERYARGARWLSVIAPLGALGWLARRRTRRFLDVGRRTRRFYAARRR